MRILHVETRHRRGGAERNLMHTAVWEARQGHEVHLALGRDSVTDAIPDVLTVHRIPALVRAVSPARDLGAYLALRRLVVDGRFDVVHTHQSKAGIVGRLAARNGPTRVHTIHMASFGPGYGRLGSAVFAAAERRAARTTEVIVAVGEELRQRYLDAGIGRPEQYLVIRSPVDIERYAAGRSLAAAQRAEVRRRLGLPDAGHLAVGVASLEPRKRVDLVIAELAPAIRAGELYLAVAGEGPERERLRALAGRLGIADRVSLLGHVDDVADLLAAADVLVHAATVEGVPQVAIQALAAGRPVVATEMIGLREVPEAPMVIVPASGTGLGAAVRRVLAEPPSPLPLTALEPWTEAAVDRGLAALHQRLASARRS